MIPQIMISQVFLQETDRFLIEFVDHHLVSEQFPEVIHRAKDLSSKFATTLEAWH